LVLFSSKCFSLYYLLAPKPLIFTTTILTL
jgi:hypothetical protein